uniref:Cyclic lactone autoinducer peptide n=1 Tax=Ascaris lumbricoides TaxID=6252 RepID=A0A0M3HMA3_ASCLU
MIKLNEKLAALLYCVVLNFYLSSNSFFFCINQPFVSLNGCKFH